MNNKLYFTGAFILVILMMTFIVVSAGSIFKKEAQIQFSKDITFSDKKPNKLDSSLICEEIEKENKIQVKCEKDKKDTDNKGIIKEAYYKNKLIYLFGNE